MDKKKTSTFTFKATTKKAPLGQRTETSVSNRLNVNKPHSTTTKTTSNVSARNNVAAKPKTVTSTFARTATSKEKLETSTKKKNEYLTKIKELEQETKSYKEKLESLPPLSEDQKALEEVKILIEQEEEKNNKDKKIFEEIFAELTKTENDVNILKEESAKDREQIDDLRRSLVDGKRENLKNERDSRMLEERQKKNEQTLYDLEDNVINFQKTTYDLFLDNRHLVNEIYELMGSAQVFCKMRPKIEEEDGEKFYSAVFDDSSITVSTNNYQLKPSKREFNFDKVFTPRSSIESLFDEVECFIKSAVGGTSIFIFLYGPQKSGKTFTLKGLLRPMGDFLFEEKRKVETIGWDLEVVLRVTEFDEEKTVLCEEPLKTGKDLVDAFSLSEEKVKTRENPLTLQLFITGKSSRLPEKICSVITIVKVSSVASLPQAEIRKTILAVSQKEMPEQIDSSPFCTSLLSTWEAKCKSLTILHISLTENKYSECINVMKLGSDIMAVKSKQKKQK